MSPHSDDTFGTEADCAPPQHRVASSHSNNIKDTNGEVCSERISETGSLRRVQFSNHAPKERKRNSSLESVVSTTESEYRNEDDTVSKHSLNNLDNMVVIEGSASRRGSNMSNVSSMSADGNGSRRNSMSSLNDSMLATASAANASMIVAQQLKSKRNLDCRPSMDLSVNRMSARSLESLARAKSSGRRTNISEIDGISMISAAMVTQQLSTLDLEEENSSDDGHEDHDKGHSDKPFYAHPQQRQRWGEDQVLPHVNWGDLFFDLFYVVAAFNLGTLLVSSLSRDLYLRGILYFVGLFGPLMNIWESQMFIASEYSVNDSAHEIIEIIRVFFVSFSIVHITPIGRMSDPHGNEMFCFVLGILLENLVNIVLKVELFVFGEGDIEAIKNDSKHDLFTMYVPQALLFLGATIVAGIQRDPSTSIPVDIPIIICLVAYVLNIIVRAVHKVWLLPKSKDFRKYSVPSNVDFKIHRYGEWVMLMLGETVISLLAATPVESEDFYSIALVGTVTIILVHVLKFDSDPHHASGHAIWRNISSGFVYSILTHILSMGLIAFGVSFKVMLKIISYDDTHGSDYETDKGHRYTARIYDESTYEGTYAAKNDAYNEQHADKNGAYGDANIGEEIEFSDNGKHRFLAVSKVKISPIASAGLYCGSLFVVLVAIQFMFISHQGVVKHSQRVFHPSSLPVEDQVSHSSRPTASLMAKFIMLVRVCLLVFLLTLPTWLSDPVHVAFAGLGVIAAFWVLLKLWAKCVESTPHQTSSKATAYNSKDASRRNSTLSHRSSITM